LREAATDDVNKFLETAACYSLERGYNALRKRDFHAAALDDRMMTLNRN
jgi:hypothetical protein